MKRKLYNFMKDEAPIVSLLTATQIAAHFSGKEKREIVAWMNYAQIKQHKMVHHHLLNNVAIKRVQ